MDKQTIIQKLTSRKFISMVITFIASVAVYFGADSGTVEHLVALAGIITSPIIYMIVEGAIDKGNMSTVLNAILQTIYEIFEEKLTTTQATTTDNANNTSNEITKDSNVTAENSTAN